MYSIGQRQLCEEKVSLCGSGDCPELKIVTIKFANQQARVVRGVVPPLVLSTDNDMGNGGSAASKRSGPSYDSGLHH